MRLALLVALSTAVVIGIEAYLEIRVFEHAVERDLLETARLHRARRRRRLRAAYRRRSIARGSRRISTSWSRRHPDAAHADDRPVERRHTRGHCQYVDRRATRSASPSPHAPCTSASNVVRERGPGRRRGGRSADQTGRRHGPQPSRPCRSRQWSSCAQRDGRSRCGSRRRRLSCLRSLSTGSAADSSTDRFGKIRDTMTRAGAGDFTARDRPVRDDEIGSVAAGLNDMLQRLQDFNDALQERVAEATAELRVRNEELVDSYQRVFVLREALARAEQLAAVGQMAASVAHQVGTPLNLISGYVQMLQQDAACRSAHRPAARDRPGADRQGRRPSSARCSITRAVRRTAAPYRRSGRCSRGSRMSRDPKLHASGIALTLDVAPDLPLIFADARGARAGPAESRHQQPRRHAGRRRADDRVRRRGPATSGIEVSDTGTGIPADLLPAHLRALGHDESRPGAARASA